MKPALITLPLCALALAGCMETQQERTLATTTAGGAALGAMITDDDRGRGAAVGAALGMATGAIINANRNQNGQCLYRDRYGRDYYAPC